MPAAETEAAIEAAAEAPEGMDTGGPSEAAAGSPARAPKARRSVAEPTKEEMAAAKAATATRAAAAARATAAAAVVPSGERRHRELTESDGAFGVMAPSCNPGHFAKTARVDLLRLWCEEVGPRHELIRALAAHHRGQCMRAH